MSEAKIVGSSHQLSQPAEAGLLALSTIAAHTLVKIRFPFTIEQDVLSVSVKIEASYSTDKGSFVFSSSPSANIGLALGVNVQDVFKHNALFSRFTVSTASTSPLRLFKSELSDSDVFASHFGVPPSKPLAIFPKQPASLLYKITRKPGTKIGPGTQKMMYMKLLYSVLRDEVEVVLERAFLSALEDSPLWEFSRLMLKHILEHARTKLTAYDLECITLLEELSTSFLDDIKWGMGFAGLGQTSDGVDVAIHMASFIAQWQKDRPKLRVGQPDPTTHDLSSIIIPVDIPSITVVHTADIKLRKTLPDLCGEIPDTAIVNVNQLIPATLRLRWTRIWDTGDEESSGSRPAPEDLEFSFEITAPADTWLLGGRRKGHFVIPARDGAVDDDLSSAPDTEAEIPLLLVPLREGWLPYPHVEIREVVSEDGDGTDRGHGHCETDYRNLGETVRVISDREQVTLSLDASGPGGGPLVLESVGRELGTRGVV